MNSFLSLNSTDEQTTLFEQEDSLSLGSEMEIDDDFSFDGFQVVRGEFFAHMKEPSISFSKGQLHVNSACIAKLPKTDFVQILVNSETKKLVIRPCHEDDRDSFIWRTIRRKDGKRVPKIITCRLFFAKLYDLMMWNNDYRYKLIGKLIKANGVNLFVFDLTACEVYKTVKAEDGKLVHNRRGVFPDKWQESFGMPVEEHDKSLQINTFNGFTVFDVKSKKPLQNSQAESALGGV